MTDKDSTLGARRCSIAAIACRYAASLASIVIAAHQPADAAGQAIELPAPMRLACLVDALPADWDSAKIFFTFDANGTMMFTVRGNSTVQLWSWARAPDGLTLKPKGSMSGGRMVGAADSDKTSFLHEVTRAGTSREGDGQVYATLTSDTIKGISHRRLGCIALKGL